MLTRHVALISETPEEKISFPDLVRVAAALQVQVTRDFGPIWGIHADVSAYAGLADMPLDYWPVLIKGDLDRPEAAGYHNDDLGEPCAMIRYTDDWSVSASHEMLEMLADPWGRHLVAGPSLQDPSRRVKYLVEVCDPCSEQFYEINGITVADFYTPHYFDPVTAHGVRYSFTGAIVAPRQILKGGYIAWHDHQSRTWWHRSWFEGDAPTDAQIPVPEIVQGSLRAAVDQHLGPIRHEKRPPRPALGHIGHNHASRERRAEGIRRVLSI